MSHGKAHAAAAPASAASVHAAAATRNYTVEPRLGKYSFFFPLLFPPVIHGFFLITAS